MENLNTRVYNIFKKLVESRDEYIKKINFEGGSIDYEVNRTKIKLFKVSKSDGIDNKYSDTNIFKYYSKGFYWSIVTDNNNIFALGINDKIYRIPEPTSRSEYAQIMDTLDETIRDWENKMLLDIENSIKDTDNLE